MLGESYLVRRVSELEGGLRHSQEGGQARGQIVDEGTVYASVSSDGPLRL